MIAFYQKYLSPTLHILFGMQNSCRYYPSCSEYLKLAIAKYGIVTGTYKGIIRILTCNPLFKGGIDYP